MNNTGRKTVRAKVTAPKAAKAAKAVTAAKTVVTAPPTREEIAVRSYEIFLARGGAAGDALQDWLQAEAELGAR